MYIQNIRDNDFIVDHENNKMNLDIDTPLALVLFYAPECPYSQVMLPLFNDLVSAIVGCRFFKVNVCSETQLVDRSSDTQFPLEYVPTMILYKNGVPTDHMIGTDYSMHKLKEMILSSSLKF